MFAISLYGLALSLGGATAAFAFWKFLNLLILPYTSSLRYLPGPPSSSWIYGNLKEIFHADNSVLHETWFEKYGATIRYKTLFNSDRLSTMDTKALNHILTHPSIYHKTAEARYNLARVLGNGLVVVEDEQHRKQRKIMNPAFGSAQVRDLTEIFMAKANELRDLWAAEVSQSADPVRLDVSLGLSRMTLDVIGIAGFDYKFDALNPSGAANELNEAFKSAFRAVSTASFSVIRMLQANYSVFRILPDKVTRKVVTARTKMERIGMQLVADKKMAVVEALQGNSKGGELQNRDLLTLLIKANMSPNVPESQRLSDNEVLAQVPTFLAAGHETTSNATTWCLWALAQVPKIQQKLRTEILSVPTENPTMEEVQALPYLDAIVRETMRLHAPIPAIFRVATRDDVIPLETPFVDVRGQTHNYIRIDKGSDIFISVLALSRAKSLWGEDAHEFKPERWISGVPDAVASISGVWGNTLSFNGGPRSCIGYRFAIVEIKCLIFALVRAFEFSLALPVEEIVKRALIVSRPLVRSEMEKGAQMPLLLKPYRPA
ncbi:predicted protein [Sparassis crispa]|uniref:Cytochrome P450 n=1 Tax=Sparassis crispa TaxID=139825 RepID=A0A401G5B3_9APHY|nr:predicted protein [Sparassis crispa]GBE77352.1 predicted protein [Sparassis crispa]